MSKKIIHIPDIGQSTRTGIEGVFGVGKPIDKGCVHIVAVGQSYNERQLEKRLPRKLKKRFKKEIKKSVFRNLVI